jgi:hypothetical protein
MEGAVFRPSDQGAPDHRRSIPGRPRKAPVPSTPSARRPAPRLIGDEPVPDLNRDSEDSQEPAALAQMEDASVPTDKLPALEGGRPMGSHVLDASSSVQLPEDLNEEESGLPPSPEEAFFSLPARSCAPEQAYQGSPPQGTLLSSRVVSAGQEPERGFAEAREPDRRLPPGSAVQQQWRASTQSHAGERASRTNNVAGGETWHIPVAGEFATRRSLFRSVWSWLTGR